MAFDPGDTRRQFRRWKTAVGRFDRQFVDRRDPDVDESRPRPAGFERHPTYVDVRLL